MCVFFVDLRDAIEEWCAGFVGVSVRFYYLWFEGDEGV